MDYQNIFNKITPKAKKNLKRAIIAGAICAVIGGGASAYASYATNVKGTVTNVNGSSVTVQDKFTARTVDLSGAAIPASALKKGERVDIERSFDGTVLEVKVKGYGHKDGRKHYDYDRDFKKHREHDYDGYRDQHDYEHGEKRLSVSEQAARAQYMAEHDAPQGQNASAPNN